MKKLLLILLCLPLLFTTCKKTECNCGDIIFVGFIDSPNEEEEDWWLGYLIVENECTFTTDTFFVTQEVHNYYNNKRRYCTGAW